MSSRTKVGCAQYNNMDVTIRWWDTMRAYTEFNLLTHNKYSILTYYKVKIDDPYKVMIYKIDLV